MANQISIIGNVFKLEKTGEPTKYFNKTDVSVKSLEGDCCSNWHLSI